MNARKKQLREHLQNIAVSGGEASWKNRKAQTTKADRLLIALRATMGKLGDGFVTAWFVRCSYRGNIDYVVMGCALDPEQQFRAARKKFPPSASIHGIGTARIKASSYVRIVESMRAAAKLMAEWPVRGSIQVGRMEGDWTPGVKVKPLPAEVAQQWLAAKRPGRPRKDEQ